MIRITGAQLLMALSIVYVVISFGIFAGTNAEKVEQGHRDSHHEKDFLQRVKRYAVGRVPLSYAPPHLYDINEGDDDDTNYAIEKRYRSNSILTNPAASHFRELQVRQRRRPSGDDLPAGGHSYRNLQFYGEPNRDIDVDMLGQSAGGNGDGVTPLTDEELQTLLLLLEGYKLQGNSQQQQGSRNFYPPQAQYFPSEDGPLVGKRETGKRNLGAHRAKSQLEQPMSFENSLSDGGAVFLGQKRSKRIGDSSLKQKSMQSSSIRIKKETDPAVEADLDKIFAGVAGDHSKHSSIPTTAISSNHQIPPPSSSSKIQKKAIDWSNYFGIDKRSDNKLTAGLIGEESKQAPSSAASSSSSSPPATMNHHHNEGKNEKKSIGKSNEHEVTSSSKSLEGGDGHPSINEKSDKLKDKKDKTRLENDTEEKADRKWILKEFYKNLAMSTNVRKRKRESPNGGAEEDVDKLEKIERKMEEAGDQIIWDSLKYTGAHKDAQLSPDELAQVKSEIIHKLAAAYSLEKIREAIEEFRQQLAQLKDKQQHY